MTNETERLFRQMDLLRPPYARRRRAQESPPPNPHEESERQLKRIAEQLKINAEQSKKNMVDLCWIIAIGFFLVLVALS